MGMKSYDSFQDWIDDQSAGNQAVIKALRALIRKAAPKLQEAVKWGNGCFIGQNNGVIYLYADKEWVQYGFFNGVSLADPKKKLEGKSQYIRHIKVRKPSDIDAPYFIKLLNQAVKSEAASPNLPTKNRPIFQGLSNPALSALAGAKITTLPKLAKFTEAQLLALHGLGPASLPILRKALQAKGLNFKNEKPEKIVAKKAQLKKKTKTKVKAKAKTKAKVKKANKKKAVKKKKLSLRKKA